MAIKVHQVTFCRICGATEHHIMDVDDDLKRHVCRMGVMAWQMDAGI